MGLLTQAEIDAMVATANELANATLIEIARPGPLANNGDPGEPIAVWTGEAKGFLTRAQHTTSDGTRERPGKTNTFHVYDAVADPDELAGPVSLASTVVIRDETRPTPVERRWTVNGVSKETEGTLDGITLELDLETAP